MLNREIRKLPKIDLHCHLDGSIPLKTGERILGREIRPEEMQVSEDCKSLEEYLRCFDLPLCCMQTAADLREVSREFLLEASKENVRYVEVRFAPMFSVNETLTCRSVIEAVLEGLADAQSICGTYYNVIVCAMRGAPEEVNREMMQAAREFLGQGVCAMDLAGNEAAYPMEEFRTLFQDAVKLGFPLTIHGGECGRVENVLEAVDIGAARIGHGIALRKQTEAISLCRKKRIAIEMCPTSNRQTKAVEDMREYPLREFLDAGLAVTINTDNRTVSNTTIGQELAYIQKHCGVTDGELRKLYENAVDASFADDAVKELLWRDAHFFEKNVDNL